jgi:orotidine-5'-phosphate decarboxylase
MSFINRIENAQQAHNSLLCVGLDPELEKFPLHLQHHPDAVFEFNRAIIDATAEAVCCFKPQIAHFAALAAEDALLRLIQYIHNNYPAIPVILDAKRGDIGSTAEKYAQEAFVRFAADAVTLNPYLGKDAIDPFLRYADKGVILLCRTSNPSAKDIQDLDCNGKPLYQRVAETIALDWNGNKNCLLVIGATWPKQLAEVRAIVGDIPFLVPGIGAQGGDVEHIIKHGRGKQTEALIISSSRAILYAGEGLAFAEAAHAAAIRQRDEINRYR